MEYNYQRLKDYALWYYFRYYPSNNKLIIKLKEKWWDDLTFSVFNDIKHLLDEENVLITKIRNYLFRNKNIPYIKNKLLEKSFPIDLINLVLERDFLEEWKSVLTNEYIHRQICLYKNKGKSKSYIKNKLIDRKEDKDIVNLILDEVFWDEWEMNWIELELEKLVWKYDNLKIIEKLLRKWFGYNDITRVLKKE